MRSTIRIHLAACNFCGKAILTSSCVVAYAADGAIRSIESEWERGPFWIAFLFVQLLILIGYAASSLPQWADWTTGEPRRRYELVGSVFAALLAGNSTYFAGLYAIGWAQIYCFLATPFSAYAGDKFIAPVAARITDAIGALFSAKISNGGPGQK